MSNPSNNPSAPVTGDNQVSNQNTNTPAPGGQTSPQSPQAGDPQGLTHEQALAELKKARQEAAQHRTKLKTFEDAEAQRQQAAMSELEKAQKRTTELEALAQTQAKQLQEMRVTQAVMLSANKHSLVDPDAAVKLLDWNEIEYDEDGKPKNIDALIAALAKAKPYLVIQQQGQQQPPAPKAPSMNPSRSQAQANPPAQPFNYANRPSLDTIWNKENR